MANKATGGNSKTVSKSPKMAMLKNETIKNTAPHNNLKKKNRA
jgi:hypothetical protein